MTRADRIALPLVLIAAAMLGFWNIAGAPAFQDDEGTYTAQAVSAQNGGLAPYTYWYDHPPLGWIQLAAIAWIPQLLGLGNGTDIGAMRYSIAVFFVVNAALVYLLARRMTARVPFAVLAAASYAMSPLSLELGRQVFLDTLAMPWLLLAFYTALSPRTALWHHVSSGVCFALATLTKITSAVLGPALLLAMVDRRGWHGRTFSIVGFLTIGGLVLAMYPLMALLRGELIAGPGHVSLQDGLLYQLSSRKGSGFVWEEGSARAGLLAGWLGNDGYLIVVGLAGGALCLLTRQTRWLTLALASLAAPVVLSQGYLPAMYIVGALPWLALAIGVGAELGWRWAAVALARVTTPPPGGPRRKLTKVAAAALPAVLAAGVLAVPMPAWAGKTGDLLASDQNVNWRRTLEWVDAHIPRHQVTLVPYSMWQDLNARGWDDPWTLIALEKVDLDSEFDQEHPQGWRAIEWIVEGPTVRPNIANLELADAERAFEESEVVETFGEWRIRRVTTDASPRAHPERPPLPEADSAEGVSE